MTTIKRVSALAAAAILCLAMAAPITAADDFTVGQFVQRLAKARGLAASDAHVADVALRGVGVRLPRDLSYEKSLTEGDVARISRSLGLNVRTSNPDAEFTQAGVDVFFVTFGDELDGGSLASDNPGQGSGPGNGVSGPPFDPFTKGKHGKGKGKGEVSPVDPE